MTLVILELSEVSKTFQKNLYIHEFDMFCYKILRHWKGFHDFTACYWFKIWLYFRLFIPRIWSTTMCSPLQDIYFYGKCNFFIIYGIFEKLNFYIIKSIYFLKLIHNFWAGRFQGGKIPLHNFVKELLNFQNFEQTFEQLLINIFFF